MELSQPPIQWLPGAFTPRGKRSGRKADHSPSSSADVTNQWTYISSPPIRLQDGAVLS